MEVIHKEFHEKDTETADSLWNIYKKVNDKELKDLHLLLNFPSWS